MFFLLVALACLSVVITFVVVMIKLDTSSIDSTLDQMQSEIEPDEEEVKFPETESSSESNSLAARLSVAPKSFATTTTLSVTPQFTSVSLPRLNQLKVDPWCEYLLENLSDSATGMPLSFYPSEQNIMDMYLLPIGNTLPLATNIENVMTRYGLNIYDGAVWSIAIAYGSLRNTARRIRSEMLLELLNRHSSEGMPPNLVHAEYLGTEQETPNVTPDFKYGDDEKVIPFIDSTTRLIDVPSPAPFLFRAIPINFSYTISDDYTVEPSAYAVADPTGAPQFNWLDFKPVLGENCWAQILYPIHTAYVKSGQNLALCRDTTISLSNINAYDFAVHFITESLPMMSAANSGGYYYSPVSSEVTQLITSAENNASLYGGLYCLKQVAEAVEDTDTITMIDTMMSNIVTHQTNCATYSTSGDNIIMGFYQGTTKSGLSYTLNDSALVPNTVTEQSHDFGVDFILPVDVQTWTIASLGPELINSTLFENANVPESIDSNLYVYHVWNTLCQACGRFDANDRLKGFGYNNVNVSEGLPYSGEWTFGAIVAAKILLDYYTQLGSDYAAQVTRLTNDIESMRDYVVSETCVDGEAFLYANRRAETGYGWNANPIPSTASTGWAVFTQLGVNPFRLQTISYD
jgi:hypothetical protein